MDVTRTTTFFLVFCFLGLTSSAGELAKCLTSATYEQHRLEKENAIRSCFNSYKTYINKDTCYLFLEKNVTKISSTKLSEEINSICFYETTVAKDMKSCLIETKKFKTSGNHDEAVFYCYQQFQDAMNRKECLKVAKQMIYPAKKEYLEQHCFSFND